MARPKITTWGTGRPDSDERDALGIRDNIKLLVDMVNEHASALDGITGGSFSATTFNVMDYLAKGDGVTDDSVAIRNAITALRAAGGGILDIPPGVYMLSRDAANAWCLNLGCSNVLIRGVRGRSWLRVFSGQSSSPLSILNMDQCANVLVDSIGFDGNWGNAVTTIATASDGTAASGSTINVVSTAGFPSSGNMTVISDTGPVVVNYTGTTPTSFTGCTGGTGTLYFGQTVGYVDAQTGINHGSQSGNPQSHGIFLRGSTRVTIRGCDFLNNYGDGVWMGNPQSTAAFGVSHILVDDCTFTLSGRNCISMVIGDDISVRNSKLYSFFQEAIDIEPVQSLVRNVVIDGNLLGQWWNPSGSGRQANVSLNIKGGYDVGSSPLYTLRNVRVTNNHILGSINTEDCQDVIIANNRIVMNWPTPGTGYPPINASFWMDNLQILNNYIYDRVTDVSVHAASITVFAQSSGAYRPQGITIAGNRIHSRNTNIGIYVQSSGGTAGDTGTATSFTDATHLNDTGKSWVANAHSDKQVLMGGKIATITGNTATQLTILGWTDAIGNPVSAPAVGAYTIRAQSGVVRVLNNHIDLSDDGPGQGGRGMLLKSDQAGARFIVEGNTVRNANGAAIELTTVATCALFAARNNVAVDDQVTPTCTSVLKLPTTPSITKWIMTGNSGDGVATLLSGPTSGTWLLDDGSRQSWAGFGAPGMTAAKGSVYCRVDGGAGTTFYVNESGTSTWVGK